MVAATMVFQHNVLHRFASPSVAPGLAKNARGRLTTARAIQARWCIDIKYGVKVEALALVQEWIQTIGTVAGLTAENTRLYSGAVGTPESRLETGALQLQVEFDTLGNLENFWAAIPPDAHKVWSERAQNFIIDGSPRWELYRACPVPLAPASKAATTILEAWASTSVKQQAAIVQPPQKEEKDEPQKAINVDQSEPESKGEERIILDWKGDPIVIKPGDKLPYF